MADDVTHKDTVIAAVEANHLTIMPTPKLPVAASEFILLRDTLFVRGPKSREMIEITFAGYGDIEHITVPYGTLPGELASMTEIGQIPEGNPPFEPVSSEDLLALLVDVIFPAFAE